MSSVNLLRPYQQDTKRSIYDAWSNGAMNVLAVLPTGAGKTVIFSDIIRDHRGASIAIAHRQELVSQISLALAQDGVRHRIIGQKSVVKLCVSIHMDEVGNSFYDPSAQCAVAGIDTLIRRENDPWFKTVSLWVQDEAHHVLVENKWGKAVRLFPNAKGLGVTATPMRMDGKGLGRHADSVFDAMVEGLGMRELINTGYLTDYRIFAPPSDLDISEVNITATGEFNAEKLKIAVKKSHIIGDVVSHYQRIAPGKLGVTFASDVETATDISRKFNEAGVPSEIVSAKTPDTQRVSVIRRFKKREIMQLVNVDIFGEGFDLPAIEVISMARPTQSYPLFVQQFGRTLRIMDGKTHGTIIDHVGNVVRHGLPDAVRTWTLDRRNKRARCIDTDVIPVRVCIQCTAVYERVLKVCPACGFIYVPGSRNGPEFVDGDLCELSPEALEALRGDISNIDMDKEQYRAWLISRNMPRLGQLRNIKLHIKRQEHQTILRDSIALWAGYQYSKGRDVSESYKRFFFKFGVDVGTAQTLAVKDATELNERIRNDIERMVLV